MNTVEKSTDWNYPLAVQWYGYSQADYEFVTNERIQTGSGSMAVGTNGNVYIGVTNGVLSSKADAFRIVDSISYEQLKGQIDNRNVRVVQQGKDANGRPWYLMRTEDIQLKQTIKSSFAYTHSHIINSIIPELLYHRNSLLMTGTREGVVAAAEAQQKPVYWSKVHPDSIGFGEDGYYELINPEGYERLVFDQVQLDNKAVDNWISILSTNEAEKVITLYEQPLKTLSVSGDLSQSYTEIYAYTDARSAYFAWPWNNQTGEGVTPSNSMTGNGFGAVVKERLKDLFKGSEGYNLMIKHLNAAERVPRHLST